MKIRSAGDAAGRLVPPEDPAAMAEAFVALAADAGVRRRWGRGRHARRSSSTAWTPPSRAYQGLYDELRGVAAQEVVARAAL